MTNKIVVCIATILKSRQEIATMLLEKHGTNYLLAGYFSQLLLILNPVRVGCFHVVFY